MEPMSMPFESDGPSLGLSQNQANAHGASRASRTRGTLRLVMSKRSAKSTIGFIAILSLLASTGCVTQGDFLRLQERVAESHERDAGKPDPFARIAQLSADVDSLREEMRDLQGELELARKEAADALVAVRQTRNAIAAGDAAASAATAAASAGGVSAGGGGSEPEASSPDQELSGYQDALGAWRADDYTVCMKRFTSFLQSWPNSGYADDAAYWLADCTYKNKEFKRAVVRFNAVVSVYPESPKAPDALYRQGESLLKLGPKFHEAARTVFKKVRKDYPESERAAEAARQLERLGAG